jgi:hypothetical protein
MRNRTTCSGGDVGKGESDMVPIVTPVTRGVLAYVASGNRRLPNHDGGMATAPLHSARDARSGVKLLLAGVLIVLAAQVWPAVPIAAAIALVAWGTSLTVSRQAGLLLVAAIVYAPLGVIAVMSQVDLAMRAESVAWAVAAGLDAAAAIVLLGSLARQTGEVWARG